MGCLDDQDKRKKGGDSFGAKHAVAGSLSLSLSLDAILEIHSDYLYFYF